MDRTVYVQGSHSPLFYGVWRSLLVSRKIRFWTSKTLVFSGS